MCVNFGGGFSFSRFFCLMVGGSIESILVPPGEHPAHDDLARCLRQEYFLFSSVR